MDYPPIEPRPMELVWFVSVPANSDEIAGIDSAEGAKESKAYERKTVKIDMEHSIAEE